MAPSHGKKMSVGDAATLFGASGNDDSTSGGDDFFGSLGSRPDTVQEEDEYESQMSPHNTVGEHHPQNGYANGFYAQANGQQDHSHGQAYGYGQYGYGYENATEGVGSTTDDFYTQQSYQTSEPTQHVGQVHDFYANTTSTQANGYNTNHNDSATTHPQHDFYSQSHVQNQGQSHDFYSTSASQISYAQDPYQTPGNSQYPLQSLPTSSDPSSLGNQSTSHVSQNYDQTLYNQGYEQTVSGSSFHDQSTYSHDYSHTSYQNASYGEPTNQYSSAVNGYGYPSTTADATPSLQTMSQPQRISTPYKPPASTTGVYDDPYATPVPLPSSTPTSLPLPPASSFLPPPPKASSIPPPPLATATNAYDPYSVTSASSYAYELDGQTYSISEPEPLTTRAPHVFSPPPEEYTPPPSSFSTPPLMAKGTFSPPPMAKRTSIPPPPKSTFSPPPRTSFSPSSQSGSPKTVAPPPKSTFSPPPRTSFSPSSLSGSQKTTLPPPKSTFSPSPPSTTLGQGATQVPTLSFEMTPPEVCKDGTVASMIPFMTGEGESNTEEKPLVPMLALQPSTPEVDEFGVGETSNEALAALQQTSLIAEEDDEWGMGRGRSGTIKPGATGLAIAKAETLEETVPVFESQEFGQSQELGNELFGEQFGAGVGTRWGGEMDEFVGGGAEMMDEESKGGAPQFTPYEPYGSSPSAVRRPTSAMDDPYAPSPTTSFEDDPYAPIQRKSSVPAPPVSFSSSAPSHIGMGQSYSPLMHQASPEQRNVASPPPRLVVSPPPLKTVPSMPSFSEDPYAPAPPQPRPSSVNMMDHSYGNVNAARRMRQQSSDSFSSFGEVIQPSMGPSYTEQRPPVPCVTFGWGGKIVTSFPSVGQNSGLYGMGYGGGSVVTIRSIEDVIPTRDAAKTFPGPLFGDGGKGAIGKKRKEVIAWLDGRVEELEKEAQYFTNSPRVEEARKTEDRITLFKIVKTLLENEGRLTGSPKVENALRSILVPLAHTAADITDADLPLASELNLNPLTPNTPSFHTSSSPIASYTVLPSHVDKIHSLLLCGEKNRALKYTIDKKLWGHAFVIASAVDQDAWKEVAQEFIRHELGAQPGSSNGRESLRVAYGLFAGAGATAVQELVPSKAFSVSSSGNHLTANGLIPQHQQPTTPMSSNFSDPSMYSNISPEVLGQWKETAAMIISNKANGDSAALTALGDVLAANDWDYAAHVCYLLSPQTSPFGGASRGSTRFSLLGRKGPSIAGHCQGDDSEGIMLTEIVEFALSLAPVLKGQEAYAGLPHLQPYRLLRAFQLVDMGNLVDAQRYHDAIMATLKLTKSPSPYYDPHFLSKLAELSAWLNPGTGGKSKAGWAKLQKPTLDSLWNTMEGTFSKLVAGDEETVDAHRDSNASGSGVVGPFSHYSSISSVPNSRPPSVTGYSTYGTDPYATDPYVPPPAWGNQSFDQPRMSDATPTQANTNMGLRSRSTTESSQVSQIQTSASDSAPSWWGNVDAHNAQPVFTPVQQSFSEDSSGFISPMAPPVGFGSFPSRGHTPSGLRETTYPDELDEVEDLGFGNSSKKRQKEREAINEQGEVGKERQPMVENNFTETPRQSMDSKKSEETAERAPIKPSGSSSWLGRWFRRDSTPTPVGEKTGPTKANLGEQTSFYYDPVQKRWVNKTAGATTAAPTPVPPPRAATASPTQAARKTSEATFGSTLGGGPPAPPPPKSASVANFRDIQRPVTTDGDLRRMSLAVPPPMGSPLPPIPPSPMTPGGADLGFGPPPPSPGAPPVSPGPGQLANPLGDGFSPPTMAKPPVGKRKNLKSRYVTIT